MNKGENTVLEDAGMFTGLTAKQALKILEDNERLEKELDKRFAGRPTSKEIRGEAIDALRKIAGKPAMKYGGASGEMLRMIVSKIEKLNEDKKEIAEYLSDTYKEAKSQGFDVKVLRQLISIRSKDQADLFEQEEILDLYKHAMGMASESDEKEAA